MKGLKWLAIASVAGGVGLLAYSAATGDTKAGFFLIFPVVVGSGLAAFGGTLLVIAGIFLGILHMATAHQPAESEGRPTSEAAGAGSPTTKVGGVFLVGPIPIVFGSDRKVTTAMLVLAIVLTVLLISFFLFVRP